MHWTRQDSHLSTQNIARMIAGHARSRAAEAEALRQDPLVPPQNMPTVLRRHGETTAAERRAKVNEARAIVAAFRDAHVLKAPPSYAPTSTAHASWVAAIVGNAPNFSPRVLFTTILDAGARGDLSLVAALKPLLESFAEYKAPFAADPRAQTVLIDATEFLRTPEVRASEDAANWADEVDSELNSLESILNGDRAIESLDVHIEVGALPHLLPPGTA